MGENKLTSTFKHDVHSHPNKRLQLVFLRQIKKASGLNAGG